MNGKHSCFKACSPIVPWCSMVPSSPERKFFVCAQLGHCQVWPADREEEGGLLAHLPSSDSHPWRSPRRRLSYSKVDPFPLKACGEGRHVKTGGKREKSGESAGLTQAEGGVNPTGPRFVRGVPVLKGVTSFKAALPVMPNQSFRLAKPMAARSANRFPSNYPLLSQGENPKINR